MSKHTVMLIFTPHSKDNGAMLTSTAMYNITGDSGVNFLMASELQVFVF